MTMKYLLAFLLLIMIVACSSPKENQSYIVNVDFNENILGWVEENTSSHHTELLDGKLLLKSIDTAALFSSNGPRDESFFWSLPDNWRFETSIEVIDGGQEAGFGFILYSASLQYQFKVSRNGNVTVSEYDYNTQKERLLFDTKIDGLAIDYNQPTAIDLNVNENKFELFVNGNSIIEEQFKAKSWETLRIFAQAKGTGIKVDYYRLKAL